MIIVDRSVDCVSATDVRPFCICHTEVFRLVNLSLSFGNGV